MFKTRGGGLRTIASFLITLKNRLTAKEIKRIYVESLLSYFQVVQGTQDMVFYHI